MIKRVKVMVIDDSAVMRTFVSNILASDPEIEVLESSSDPIFAMPKMEKDWPDVLILDVEMPRMNGITFLKKLMSERPTPAIVISSRTGKNMPASIEALRYGAVEIFQKPEIGLKDFLENESQNLIAAVKSAAHAKLDKIRTQIKIEPVKQVEKKAIFQTTAGGNRKTGSKIIAIGASTGGTTAIEEIVANLKENHSGIVITQHMPPVFTNHFANRLNNLYNSQVKEAEDGDVVLPGTIFIAPGGRHMIVVKTGEKFIIRLHDAEPVNRHRPSVDVLFDSIAAIGGSSTMGIILTGMGNDGAAGLLAMKNSGAYTVAQDAATCVVFGMPAEAIAKNAALSIKPIDDMADEIMKFSHD